jgi:PIN domain nuclease of toxin-antitoxin system
VRLLADTHVVFWATMERSRLSQVARAALESEQNEAFVSVASAWEIAIKVGLGKWPEARDLLFDFEQHMADGGFELLPITVAHVRTAGLISNEYTHHIHIVTAVKTPP